MTTEFQTNFTVMPSHCNYMTPLIFGGKLMAELDLAAAGAVKGVLRHSECTEAVTYKWGGTFHGPSYLGDILYITATVVELKQNAIVVKCTAYREPHEDKEPNVRKLLVAEADFVFVSKKDGKFHPHGLGELFNGRTEAI